MNIAILHHPQTDLDRPRHMIWILGQHWTAQGHRVSHHLQPGPQVLAADVVFLHIDLTVLPPSYARLLHEHPCVINRHATDISKTRFSEIRLSAAADHDGPVIIKTISNYGGRPEENLKQSLVGNPVRPVFDWATASALGDYPVLPSLAAVPSGVWLNPHLMVEKYVPEKTPDGLYAVREWVFLGRCDVHYMNLSHEPVIKGQNTVGKVMMPDEPVPEKLREIRRQLGMDYGKFDYVIHEGQPVLYDANKTMGGIGVAAKSPELAKAVETLAKGIEDFI